MLQTTSPLSSKAMDEVCPQAMDNAILDPGIKENNSNNKDKNKSFVNVPLIFMYIYVLVKYQNFWKKQTDDSDNFSWCWLICRCSRTNLSTIILTPGKYLQLNMLFNQYFNFIKKLTNKNRYFHFLFHQYTIVHPKAEIIFNLKHNSVQHIGVLCSFRNPFKKKM